MKALILNSGIGKRLGEMTQSCPKCMLRVDENETILCRQLSLLADAGITEVIIRLFHLTIFYQKKILRLFYKMEESEKSVLNFFRMQWLHNHCINC